MKANQRISALALSATLLGCAVPAPEVPVSPASPTHSFDGVYSGTIRVTGVGSGGETIRSVCYTPEKITLSVTDSAFTYAQSHPRYPDNPIITYTASVARDGTVRGTSDRGTSLVGHITYGQMSGGINGLGCFYEFSAQRS
jgi:hypothetical protein